MKVHTEAVSFKADQKLIDFIEAKLTKMDRYFDRIIEARMTLKLENSGQVRDKIAELSVSVPGDTLFVKGSAKTFESSVDNAASVMRRQLIRHKDRQRRKVD
jgi:putative sigma-54 modulation protein